MVTLSSFARSEGAMTGYSSWPFNSHAQVTEGNRTLSCAPAQNQLTLDTPQFVRVSRIRLPRLELGTECGNAGQTTIDVSSVKISSRFRLLPIGN